MVEKATFGSTEEKENWLKVVRAELMSSEESGADDDEEDEVFVVRPLPWISSSVGHFLIDDESVKRKSPQARRQMKPRHRGLPSSRPKPAIDGLALVSD